jgi:FkbM family methyltransferase
VRAGIYCVGDLPDTLHNRDTPFFPADTLPPLVSPHVFCLQSSRPAGKFNKIALWLHDRGVSQYTVEAWSLGKLWKREKRTWSMDEWNRMSMIYDRLEDKDSKYAFAAACKADMEGEAGYIPLADYPQYEHPLAQAAPGDIICNGGLDDERQTLQLLCLIDQHGAIHAFEPHPQKYLVCRDALAAYSNIRCINKALWTTTGAIPFNLSPFGSSHASTAMLPDSVQCECISIDDYFASPSPSPNYIKLDVEGAELPVLRGAELTIKTGKPKLGVSIYHNKGKDLLDVPAWLVGLDLNYTYYVGHHRAWFAETVLYAIHP